MPFLSDTNEDEDEDGGPVSVVLDEVPISRIRSPGANTAPTSTDIELGTKVDGDVYPDGRRMKVGLLGDSRRRGVNKSLFLELQAYLSDKDLQVLQHAKDPVSWPISAA